MKDILITIFSIQESIYLAYWINIDDTTFYTINFPELLNQDNINTPFLSDVEKIINLFPEAKEKGFFVSFIRNENILVIVYSKEEEYLPISKNLYFLVQDSLLRNKKNEIENYIENIFSDTVNAEIQELLSEMHGELMKYSSFISVYDYESDNLVASTLHKKRDENKLAREIFLELKRLELIKKIELEIEVKKIGSLQAFYFYLKGLVFVVYSINIQVNTGIIRLKLKTFLKNKPILSHIYDDSIKKTAPKIVELDLDKTKTSSFTMKINF